MQRTWKIQSHEPAVGSQESSVDGKVSRAARERLNINTPLGAVAIKDLQGALLSEHLNLIDDLITTVVS